MSNLQAKACPPSPDSQQSDHTPRQQRLQTRHDPINHRHSPHPTDLAQSQRRLPPRLPPHTALHSLTPTAPPHNHHRIGTSQQMRSFKHDDSPEESELPDVLDVIEVGRLNDGGRPDEPVEGWEVRRVVLGGDGGCGVRCDERHLC